MISRCRDREEIVGKLGVSLWGSVGRRRDGEKWFSRARTRSRSLVVGFRRARQSGQVSERLLDLSWDWWRSGKVSAVRLVTVLVGYVTGLDCLTVGGDVGHGSLEHGHWSFGAGLQVSDLLLLDSVVGLEAAKFRKMLASLNTSD